MSRTNKRDGSSNPAKKFISLSGKSGKFGYYDKVNAQTIELEYPITFLPLDVLATIKGYNKPEQTGFYSNEIHNTNSEILKVKLFNKGDFAEGLYSDIKDKIKANGGKYCSSVYAMMYNENGEPELVNFQLIGAALTPFIEYTKSVKDIYKKAIQVTGSNPSEEGGIEYFIPVFAEKDVSPETSAKADELDIKLQEFLEQYKSGITGSELPKEDEIDESTNPANSEIPKDESDVPF